MRPADEEVPSFFALFQEGSGAGPWMRGRTTGTDTDTTEEP